MNKNIISNISVAGMLRFLCNYKKTGIFVIEVRDNRYEISLYEGKIINIKPLKNSLKETLIDILISISDIVFYFEEKEIKEKGSEIEDVCIEDIILESGRILAQKNPSAVKNFLLPENEVLKISNFAKDREIYIKFKSDEWNFLILFDGNKTISYVYEICNLEKEKAEVILYCLLSAGLLRRTRFKMPELIKIAREEFGNIGVAIVETEIIKNKIDKNKMGMREFLRLLAAIENSFAEIVGRQKANNIIEKIWSATK